MKKWLASILALVMLSQALPWTAFAATGDMITDSELRRALQIAGLRPESSGSEAALFAAAARGEVPLRLEAGESGYHPGMKPDATWDARMLTDWLDDKLTKDIYNVTNVFTWAETILDRLKDKDPAACARFTEGAKNAEYVNTCHKWAMDAEAAEEQARFYRRRVSEYAVVIEQNAETLSNGSAELFDYEKSRLSEQIRETTEALEALREDILGFSIAQVLVIITGQAMIDGNTEPEFSQWLKSVLDFEDAPKAASVPASAVMSASYNTRMSRMASGQRVLAADNTRDVAVQVLSENDFAFIFRGVDNQYVGGVKVTMKDLNGSVERVLMSDDEFGAVVFNANDFVCDYDKEMELSLAVEAEAAGYRDFSIPWLTMKRGGKRTETLVLLSGPEDPISAAGEGARFAAGTSDAKPYAVSCEFNGYDILRQDKNTTISKANDAKFNFELILNHPAGMTPGEPLLYCWMETRSNNVSSLEKREFKPTGVKALDRDSTKFIYTDTWKRDLSPDITVSWTDPSEDQRPYFVLPDTGEVVRTTLVPVRAKVNQPIVTGQETKNPLNQVMGKGFGLDFEVPGIGGKLSFGLPFEQYLPKVSYNPIGYITVLFGASGLKDPADATLWKNKEAEAYDKAMKQYQHESSIAKQKQKLGTARQYYKSVLSSKGQARMKLDFGYFLMLSGRAERDDTGGVNWTVSGAAGGSLLFSVDYTQPMSIGPIPFYLNINFSASAGICLEGLYFSFAFDRDDNYLGMEWWVVRGVTIDFRLALTVSLGIGVKGVCSVWVSATGALNIIITMMFALPLHVAVYAEIIISVGFEIFWIKYSRPVSNIPKWKIWNNYNLDTPENPNKKSFALFTALADTPETDEAALTPLEPERYSALAPVAKVVMDNAADAQAGIKAAEVSGHTYVFYIAESTDREGRASRNINWIEPATGRTGIVEDWCYNTTVSRRDAYAFDVLSNGSRLAVIGCCSDAFEENGYPSGNTGVRHAYCYAVLFGYDDELGNLYGNVGNGNNTTYAYQYLTGYNVMLRPHIDALTVDENGAPFVTGSCDALYDATGEKGCVNFQWDGTRMHALGDFTVKNALGDDHERVQMRSTLGKYDTLPTDAHSFVGNAPSPGFIALSMPRDGAAGDSAIELYDYYMNVAPITYTTDRTDKTNPIMTVTGSERRAVALATGDIDHMEMVQDMKSDGTIALRTVFYTQTETVGERAELRLKSLSFQPRTVLGKDDFRYDVSYSDYDVSLPDSDFRAVTLGASKYLYWLSTVSKKKESDPDIWRITGVYYDSAVNTVSDQIVIAEFSLPDSRWNGRTYRSVPFEIMLTESGTGYITAKPDTGDESDRAVAPMTLYSFPISLKPVANLTGASLTETTVCQGEFIATDLAVMNEGNMGIGSFDLELWLMENGSEARKIETLHADCLYPGNSRLVLHSDGRDETVARGEAAFYRLKDFDYSPRQREWIVKSRNRAVAIRDGSRVTITDGGGEANRVATNVLVPGALGGYTGSIKIPSDWHGRKALRLKLVRESTYSNWLAAAALAQRRPELFAEGTGEDGALYAAGPANETLAALGIEKLIYELDEESGRLALRQPEALFEAGPDGDGGETVSLYAAEIEAPAPVDINCDVHDIDVGHRLWADYYGEPMLGIVINNYHTTEEAVELTCAVYLDGSNAPRYVGLPYDPSALSAGKTTTITLPLKALIPDADQHREARVVIAGRGIEETATVNNTFTLRLGGSGALSVVEQPRSVAVPVGGDATFTVGVTGGKAPYQYQWQVYVDGEWRDIPGANGAALTLDHAKADWNGRRTRCAIADAAGGAAMSDEAVLTVTGGSDRPDTGDRSNLPLWLSVALIAIAMLLILRRRARETH